MPLKPLWVKRKRRLPNRKPSLLRISIHNPLDSRLMFPFPFAALMFVYLRHFRIYIEKYLFFSRKNWWDVY
jgi:hypothetical protein